MSTRTATKSPSTDGQPFEFNLNTVRAEVELKPFRFLWGTKDDPNRRFVMKHLMELDVWDLLAAADSGNIGAMIGAFKAALGEDEFASFQKTPLPQYKLQALFKAYREACGDAEGESPASSDS
ncbi:hypothetical protein [Streptomyces sp. NPDC005732]|uniref:hypothetical protein n=1 Tax=Streptomyces sp. NPDC005732 TaxID=3157057 RepID=UPI0033DE907F